MFVLSLCNDIVATFSSSYGSMAAGLSGIIALNIFPKCFPNATVQVYIDPHWLSIHTFDRVVTKVLSSNVHCLSI